MSETPVNAVKMAFVWEWNGACLKFFIIQNSNIEYSDAMPSCSLLKSDTILEEENTLPQTAKFSMRQIYVTWYVA